MSIARYLTLALSTWPGAALSAQVSAPSTPPIRLPDLTALAPALARAQAGLVQAQMALGTAAARTQADLGRTQAELGIATTRVQARMVRAQGGGRGGAARGGGWEGAGR